MRDIGYTQYNTHDIAAHLQVTGLSQCIRQQLQRGLLSDYFGWPRFEFNAEVFALDSVDTLAFMEVVNGTEGKLGQTVYLSNDGPVCLYSTTKRVVGTLFVTFTAQTRISP